MWFNQEVRNVATDHRRSSGPWVIFVVSIVLLSGLFVALTKGSDHPANTPELSLSSVQTFHNYAGYNGNATIYPTEYPNSTSLPILDAKEIQTTRQSGMNIANFNELNVSPLANETPAYGWFKYVNTPEFGVNIWVSASGGSSQGCGTYTNYAGCGYTGAIGVLVTPSGFPSDNTNYFVAGNNTGYNVSNQLLANQEQVTRPNLLLSLVSLGLDGISFICDAAVVCDAITLLSIGIDLSDFLGTGGDGTNVYFSGAQNDVSGDSTAVQWEAVQNGTWGTEYKTPVGVNAFSQGDWISNFFSDVNRVTPGSLTIASQNFLVGGDVEPWDTSAQETTEIGANDSLSYGVAPAVSLNGTVDLSYHGQPANGALVTIQQTCSGTVIDFTETTNAAGFWHFFANPNSSCSYAESATAPNPDGIGTLTSPTISLGSLGSDEGRTLKVPTLNLDGGQVTFSETGLTGVSWTVQLNGVDLSSSNGAPIWFVEANSTTAYSFYVYVVTPYVATPSSSTVLVSGGNVGKTIAISEPTYSVTFTESGLSGQSWSVTLAGSKLSSTGTSIAFTEYDGSYLYSVGAPSGYLASPSSGSVTVSGGNVKVSISFTKNTGTYSVTFTETKLPSGSTWYVYFNGVEHSTTSSTISFTIAAGTYSWSVGTTASAPSGFHWQGTPSGGQMTVSTNESQAIVFLEERNP